MFLFISVTSCQIHGTFDTLKIVKMADAKS